MFEKKSFKVLATSSCSEIVLPFSINKILFSEKNGGSSQKRTFIVL